MNFLTRIFDVFSRRTEFQGVQHTVPEKTRKRILLWQADVFSNRRSEFGWGGDYRDQFWEEIHRFLQQRHGEFSLFDRRLSPADDAASFLLICEAEDFLDFLEYLFRVDCLFRVSRSVDELVEELNQLLRIDDLPYHVTNLVQREGTREAIGPVALGGGARYIETIAFPRVVMRESKALHQEAVGPALALLEDSRFQYANAEFLEALADYRTGDLEDCLTKCSSALESVMKVICNEKGWETRSTDTAAALLKTVLAEAELPGFLEQPLITSAMLRNKLGSSHGAGSTPRKATRAIAHYAINATASAILFLAEQVGFA